MAVWQRVLEMIGEYPLSFLPDYFLLAGTLFGLFNLFYLNRSTRVVLLMFVLCLLVEVVLIYYAAKDLNNHFLFNLISLVETACLTVVYYNEIAVKKSRRLIIALFILYLISFVYSFEWMRIAEHLLTIERLVLIGFVGIHFHYILSGMRIPNILLYSMFWVSVGVIVYAAGTFFIFLFTRITLSNPRGSIDFLWYLSIVRWFTCLFYVVLTTAFYFQRREALTHTAS